MAAMTEPPINCPDCGTIIRLTESLAAPLLPLHGNSSNSNSAKKTRRSRSTKQELEKKRVRLSRRNAISTNRLPIESRRS